MTGPVTLWLDTAHLGALRIGGYAWVRKDGSGLSGAAGGGRLLDAERNALAAFDAALGAMPAGAAVELRSASPDVLALPERIARAKAGDEAPDQHLDLWARASAHLDRLNLTVRPAPSAPGTPTAFAAAWAERACDLARSKGTFSAAIPKPNLAKAGVI